MGAGEIFALCGAVCFAFANVAVFKAKGRGVADGVFLSVVVTLAFSAIVWLLIPGDASWPRGAPLWIALAWFAASGLLTTVFGRMTLFRSIEALGVSRASAVKRLNPLFSVLIGALVLGETISGVAGIGIALLAASFAIMIWRSWPGSAAVAPQGDAPPSPLAYAYGPGSALCYACGYAARKVGLGILPDAAFGTLVGALAALAFYLAGSLVSPTQRKVVRAVLHRPGRWQLAAALFVSSGQVLQFAAIQHAPISKVAMIASLEIYISIFLAVVVLRTERRPDAATLRAAVLAGIGAGLVALG